MLDLLRLETFRVVAATSNFTRAAAELGCCQSTVTVHIRELERELGVQLFDRCRFSKKVVLTEAGRCTLEYAGRLITLADEAKAAAVEADAAVLNRTADPNHATPIATAQVLQHNRDRVLNLRGE